MPERESWALVGPDGRIGLEPRLEAMVAWIVDNRALLCQAQAGKLQISWHHDPGGFVLDFQLTRSFEKLRSKRGG